MNNLDIDILQQIAQMVNMDIDMNIGMNMNSIGPPEQQEQPEQPEQPEFMTLTPTETKLTQTQTLSQTQSQSQSPNENIYGCNHYLRRCKILAPCCNKIYTCRLCHDENETHNIDRFSIKKIICTHCGIEQVPKKYCEKCNTCMGLYFCQICNLFDDIDKKQYHCDKCGLCRVGSDVNYHCDKCNRCLNKNMQGTHICTDQMGSACPICLNNLFDSVYKVTILKCGHHIHNLCLEEYLETNYKCPICCHSIGNMDRYNNLLDIEIENTPMPEEYNNTMHNILCNDCHTESLCKFHIIGMKCTNCGSYNTRNL